MKNWDEINCFRKGIDGKSILPVGLVDVGQGLGSLLGHGGWWVRLYQLGINGNIWVIVII